MLGFLSEQTYQYILISKATDLVVILVIRIIFKPSLDKIKYLVRVLFI
jgi:hypothetical protein